MVLVQANAGDVLDKGSKSGLGRSPGGGHGNPLQFLPGESCGQRSLVGYSPWGYKVNISNQSHYIYHYIHCICVIKPRVSVIPHPLSVFHHTLYVWHNIQYACYHNNCLGHYTPIGITSHPGYLWHHIQYVCYHNTVFMKTQRLYRAS